MGRCPSREGSPAHAKKSFSLNGFRINGACDRPCHHGQAVRRHRLPAWPCGGGNGLGRSAPGGARTIRDGCVFWGNDKNEERAPTWKTPTEHGNRTHLLSAKTPRRRRSLQANLRAKPPKSRHPRRGGAEDFPAQSPPPCPWATHQKHSRKSIFLTSAFLFGTTGIGRCSIVSDPSTA